MSLYAFLHPETPDQKEVVFERFKDENGKVVPFLIKPITSEENKILVKKCSNTDKSGKKHLDTSKYQTCIVIAGTVVPDFTDAELCEGYGVVDPEMVVGRMLYAGEYMKLANEILRLSGLDDESGEEAEEEAKN